MSKFNVWLVKCEDLNSNCWGNENVFPGHVLRSGSVISRGNQWIQWANVRPQDDTICKYRTFIHHELEETIRTIEMKFIRNEAKTSRFAQCFRIKNDGIPFFHAPLSRIIILYDYVPAHHDIA